MCVASEVQAAWSISEAQRPGDEYKVTLMNASRTQIAQLVFIRNTNTETVAAFRARIDPVIAARIAVLDAHEVATRQGGGVQAEQEDVTAQFR